MYQKQRHEILVGSVFTTALASFVLAAVTLSALANPSSGDLQFSATISTLASQVILVVGMLGLVGLEWLHVARRRERRVAVGPADDRGSRGAHREPAAVAPWLGGQPLHPGLR